MDSDSIQFELLFDAETYHRSGKCPWTFFAYPTSLATDRDLPPDEDACHLLAKIQKRGIRVAVWVSRISENTTFFACRMEDIQRVKDALTEIDVGEQRATDFFINRSKELFATIKDRPNPRIISTLQNPPTPTDHSAI